LHIHKPRVGAIRRDTSSLDAMI